MATDEIPTRTPGRDADSWARHAGPLSVGHAPEGALNLNVEGRELAGPMQGFGRLWQKTYRVGLPGVDTTPEAVIAAWKANYGELWPEGNDFYAPLAGIQPGEVGLINADMPGGMRLSTGVMVLYADEVSFTYMTPIGHPFAGWITFSADDRDGHTSAQVQVLMRGTDPASELGLALGGHRTEDRMWQQTLRNLAAHVGCTDAEPTTEVVCIDRRRQWRRAGNIRHDAALHTAAHLLSAPVRAIGMSWRGLLTAAVVTNALFQVAFMVLAGIVIPPAVVIVGVQVVGLVLATRRERTGAGVVAVGGAVQLVAYSSFALPGLLMPQSPLDFLDAVLGFLTAATMVVAGIALVRRRAGSPTRLASAGAVVVAVAAVVAVVGAATATKDTLDAGEVEVAADGYAWTVTELSVGPDDTLHVDNRDPSHHTFAVPALGLEVALPGSTARDLPLDGAAAGVYDFLCTVPGHEAMVGTLEVAG